jgi:hypothetical protein
MPGKRRNVPVLETHHVTIECGGGGCVVSGSYSVARGLITVSNGHGTKVTQVGGSPPAILARIMLRELAQERYSTSAA